MAQEEDQLALRQMDEFFNIEKCLGEVAGVVNLTYNAESFEAGEPQYIEFAEPAPVAKVAKAAEGDGEEEDGAGEEATPPEEGGDKGPKFEPRDY